MKSVLITGAAGFLGRYTAQFFSELGCTVIGIDSIPPENAPLAHLTAYHNVKLPDKALDDLLRTLSPDVCIHCAGRASVPLSVSDPSADFYTNTVLTFEVLEALRLHAPACRFILLSSAAVYGNPQTLPVNEEQPASPISPYGFHKWQCEQLCSEFARIYGLKTASVRIFSAYGPGLRRQVLWDMCFKVITGHALKLQGTGRESRDFIHARDVAKALHIVAANAPMQGETYNLASGNETTILELASLVLDALNEGCSPQFDGVIPQGNPVNWQADITKLHALGFTPDIPLKQGIRTFATWCRAEIASI
ncbi:NAD-dependent epimerase/dehydratase family protein [Oryzomonas rubra]|uniref:NAD-dependent epimerase/dehydratase family protein n=1 Tax=Oryzomonas rubra TaxID=2509454 RepID=A0A5A9XP06_9BACT|nr:NAD-dependent epimerase/dehydratase family protein [Oryzomonas rubra]KAA0893321.1 NAD-dependent epimerase/dehydratase family protein [Oryzomonas rubra]